MSETLPGIESIETEPVTATHIAMARSRLGYSQVKLSQESHLSQKMVSRIERGKIPLDVLKDTSPHQYLNLLRALELDKISIQVVEIRLSNLTQETCPNAKN